MDQEKCLEAVANAKSFLDLSCLQRLDVYLGL
jgi:hypothetical protein